jgi:hypothetical protein
MFSLVLNNTIENKTNVENPIGFHFQREKDGESGRWRNVKEYVPNSSKMFLIV